MKSLICQECGGSGEYADDHIDFGGDECGPIMIPVYVSCGWCKGTGKVSPKVRGSWLHYRKYLKRGM